QDLAKSTVSVPQDPTQRKQPLSGAGKVLIIIVSIFLVVGAVSWYAIKKRRSTAPANAGAGARMGQVGPVPVLDGVVARADVPIYLDGLGTVQAFNTVTIRPRVDGQVQKVAFIEGQDVHAGDLLAQIDPAPYQTQVEQAEAKKAQDEAQLAVARLTFKRDTDLLANKILSQQEYDTQNALVKQLEATVKADQAAT